MHHDDVNTKLDGLLTADPGLRERLEHSLVLARDRAADGLDPLVRQALDWPVDLPGYRRYLADFLRWIPRQSDDPAWREPSPGHSFAEEVSIRVAHFFWLVDQHDGDGPAVEDSAEFCEWLTAYAQSWGTFLDTTESFDAEVLRSFVEGLPRVP